MYDPGVFDMIRRTKPSAHGELETNSADSEHRKQNKLAYAIVDGEWTDASAFESYQHANALLFSIDNTVLPGECHADTF
jgi:dTDP-glucose pyrophosphorylase